MREPNGTEDHKSMLQISEAVEELLAAVKQGDDAAKRRLVEAAMQFVHPAVLHMLHQRRAAGSYLSDTLGSGSSAMQAMAEDAWDITHATCCAMLANLASFKGRGFLGRRAQFTTWLYAIAQNQVRSALRKRWRERRRRYDVASDDDGFDPADLADPEVRGSPEAASDEAALRALVAEGLDQAPLTPEQREAMVMFFVWGHRQDRIAAATGVQLGTVKKRIFDGVRKVRAYVEARSGETPEREGAMKP